MLPVVTGRFLFSQAPDLLLPMWKQGQLQPGWLQVGRPDPAQRGLSGPITPGPDPGQWMARVNPPLQAPILPVPNSFRQEEGARQGYHSRLSRWSRRAEVQGRELWSQLCPLLTECLWPSLT